MYLVVKFVVATGFATLELFNPADGDHEYVEAPVAFNGICMPGQAVVSPNPFTLGLLLVVTFFVTLSLQPLISVTTSLIV
jgi:hypothetical protein